MLRKIILSFAGLCAALVLAMLVVPLFVNPDSFKGPIARQLEAATGYRVELGGDMSIRALPFVRVRADKVKLYSPVDPKPFAELQALDVGVRLLPLLYGQVNITNVSLKSPVLRLVASNGRGNWEVPRAKPLPGGQVPEEKGKVRAGNTVQLDRIEITDGTLTYKDVKSGSSLALAKLNVDASMGSSLKLNAKAEVNGKPVGLKAKADAFADMLAGRRTPLTASFASAPLSFDMDGTTDGTVFTGKLSAKSVSLTAAADWLSGKEQKSTGVPLAFELKGDADCSFIRCGIKNIDLRLDNSQLTGSLASDMGGNKPSLSADFSTKMLDVTPYMKKKQARVGWVADAYADEGRWSKSPIDLSGLGAIDGNFTLNAEQVVADTFKAGKALLRVRLRNGNLSSDAGFGELYKGKGNGSLSIAPDGRVEGLIILDEVQVEPLMAAVADSKRFSGTLNTRTNFTSSGKSQQALVSNLNGSGQLRISDGSINGIDIAGMVRNVKSAFADIDTSQRKTDFSEMGGTFTIANGVVSNNDLALKAPLLRVSGAGKVDLPNYRIHYKLTPQVVDTLKGQGGKDKQGLGVPILISGPLDNPSYAPDLAGVVEKAIQDPAALKQQLKEGKEGIKDLLKGGKGLLKGL